MEENKKAVAKKKTSTTKKTTSKTVKKVASKKPATRVKKELLDEKKVAVKPIEEEKTSSKIKEVLTRPIELFEKEEKIVEKEEKQTFSTLEVIILIFITCLVTIGLTTGVSKVMNKEEKKTVDTEDAALTEFIENYNYILDNYYGEIDQKAALSGAIKGLLEALGDDYTTIITEEEEDQYNIKLEGTYQGLGIEIVNTYEYLKDDNGTITGYIYKDIEITKVFPDSPAEKAGLEVGDLIIELNGINMQGKLSSELTALVKTTKEDITLKVNRGGTEKTFIVSTKTVTIPSVTTKYITKNNQKIAYINIDLFAANTDEQFIDALDDLEKDTYGIIIDVRDNSGGHLDTVQNMLSAMLDKTKVVYQLDTKGKITKKYSTGTNNFDKKIVILINESSASASELLTISLKENLGATTVGTHSYGKGTVQQLLTLDISGEQYKITTQSWLSPNGNSINKVGITPDINVALTGEKGTETDNQFQTALDTIVKDAA